MLLHKQQASVARFSLQKRETGKIRLCTLYCTYSHLKNETQEDGLESDYISKYEQAFPLIIRTSYYIEHTFPAIKILNLKKRQLNGYIISLWTSREKRKIPPHCCLQNHHALPQY